MRDANERMVADGFAWNAVQYSKSDILAELEVAAREARRGLWVDVDPFRLWDWRNRK